MANFDNYSLLSQVPQRPDDVQRLVSMFSNGGL